MSDKKYLDGGLTHLWDKIKKYLGTWIAGWKTTNFGSETYLNNGSLNIPTDTSVSFNATSSFNIVIWH